MLFLGLDIGSSFVKASLLEGDSGRELAHATAPDTEMPLVSQMPGWAEQDPEMWWKNTCTAVRELIHKSGINATMIQAIGIAYQMHGLVLVDESGQAIRPAIIWCDGRAVSIGRKAFEELGHAYCFGHLLNAPGNFTLSRLAWVKENEPELYEKARYFMLPGDFIAMKLTGYAHTTAAGLSEAMAWDHTLEAPATGILSHFGVDPVKIPPVCPTFSMQGETHPDLHTQIGLPAGIPVTYRSGDQPNNAFSLGVLNPGELAASGGTSGVLYGLSEKPLSDELSRLNTFLNVNHQAPDHKRYGLLMCINGAGIQNSWVRKITGTDDFEQLNQMAMRIPPGAGGLRVYPFGNGPERLFEPADPGAAVEGIRFNTHTSAHLARAAQEGVAFSMYYGLRIMQELGMTTGVIRASAGGMFLSPVFCQALSGLSGAPIELYATDGAQGAARAAALGFGYYGQPEQAFRGLRKIISIEPDPAMVSIYRQVYEAWSARLSSVMNTL